MTYLITAKNGGYSESTIWVDVEYNKMLNASDKKEVFENAVAEYLQTTIHNIKIISIQKID